MSERDKRLLTGGEITRACQLDAKKLSEAGFWECIASSMEAVAKAQLAKVRENDEQELTNLRDENEKLRRLLVRYKAWNKEG